MPYEASSKRYAQAIFQLGHEMGTLEKWTDDLSTISEYLQNGDFRSLLQQSKISLSDKVAVIEELLRDSQPEARNLVGLLSSRGLVDIIPQISIEFEGLLDVFYKRERVRVVSAIKLSDSEKETITKLVEDMTKNSVILDTNVDSKILGGLILHIGDNLIDGSTLNHIQQLRNRLGSGDTTAVSH